MARNRAWRRHKLECKVKNRLRRLDHQRWRRLVDANGINIPNPSWVDFIGTQSEFMYKYQTTHKYDTRYKSKWGKKGKKNYDYSSDPWTRVKDKNRFLKILMEELSELK